jgi:hypothetical protein
VVAESLDSLLYLAGTLQDFAAGDVLIMLGDCIHGGSAWDFDEPNFRLFCYLPSDYCLPIWESVVSKDSGKESLLPRLTKVSETDYETLIHSTSPKDPGFNMETFNKYLYCSKNDEFFYFDEPSYYQGLQTINAGVSIYTTSRDTGVFSGNAGVCLHWPSQASLVRAGLVSNTFRDLRRNVDCPVKEDADSQCTSMSSKRMKTEPLPDAQSVSASTTKHVVQPETLSVQLTAAYEQIRLLNEIIKAKDQVIAALQKQPTS